MKFYLKNINIVIFIFIILLYFNNLNAQDNLSDKILRIAIHPLVENLMIKVANNFQNQISFIKTPDNILGTTIGINKLCAQLDENINILATNRLLNQYEKNLCAINAKEGLLELKIGYYALFIVDNNKNPEMNLSKRDIFMALADKMPNYINPNSENIISNWSEIYKLFPSRNIKIYGPSENNIFYDYLIDNIIVSECMKNPYLQRQYRDFPKMLDLCTRLNKNYNGGIIDEQSLAQTIINEPYSFGFISYSNYDYNKKNLKLNSLDGIFPSLENIRSSKYSLSYPIYIYIKKSSLDNILIKNFIKEITSPNTIGAKGYLVNYGFISID